MTIQDPREIQTALSAPFAPEDLEWRIQTALKEKLRGLAVPYVTNRTIQSRLDEVVGPENWRNEYQPWHSATKKGAQICGIAIYFEGRGWVQKWDGAEDSDIEPIKGGLSDSMKRAAVQWGVGRALYNMDTVWVDIEPQGNSFVIKNSERAKLNRAYLGMLDGLHILPKPASGTQAQLTPTPPENDDTEDAPAPETRQPATETRQPTTETRQPATENTSAQQATPSAPTAPAYDYIVQLATVQRGMSKSSTSLTMLDRDGKKKQAFAQGVREELVPGAKLRNVKLTQRQQDTVVFYVLEGYEIAASGSAAA